MTKSRKVWVKPELIILVRSKPEEAVLTGCKTAETGNAQGVILNYCFGVLCAPCSDPFAS